MKRIRQIREFSQEEKAQILEANAQLLAKREARAKACPSAYIPIRTAGELVTELLGVTDINPFTVVKRCFERLIWADVEAADGVIGEPLANAVERGVYTIGKDGKRIPITEQNWESTCDIVTIDGRSFCRTRLFWDGKLFGEGGHGA